MLQFRLISTLAFGFLNFLDLYFVLNEILSSPQERNLGEIKQLLREATLEESRKRELSSALHVYFKDWLYGSIFFFLSFLIPFDSNMFDLHIYKELSSFAC